MTNPTPLSPDVVNAIVRDMDDPRYPAQITVFCDRLGCGAEFTGDYMVSEEMSSEERLAVARKHLVDNEGWEHTDDGDDFCPEHAGDSSGSSFVKPADRPAEWARMAVELAAEGRSHAEIAVALCADESTVARLLASDGAE